MMSARQSLFHNFCLALFITISIGVGWCVVVEWGLRMAWMAYHANQPYDNLYILVDGTPIVSASGPSTRYFSENRKLDGTIIKLDRLYRLQPAIMYLHTRSTGDMVRLDRIRAFRGAKHTNTAWYCVDDGSPEGHAYFVGYDSVSRVRIGFIGRAGFCEVMPSPSEQISLGHRTLTDALTSALEARRGFEPYTCNFLVNDERVPRHMIYLISGRDLLRVDLSARTVEKVWEADDMLSITMAERPEAVSGDPAVGPRKTKAILVVRHSDHVTVMNLDTTQIQEFPIPNEVARSTRWYCYVLSDDEILTIAQHEDFAQGARRKQLYWVDSAGQIKRRERVALRNPYAVPPILNALARTAVLPEPTAFAVDATVIQPNIYRERGGESNDSSALKHSLAVCWPFFCLVLGVSAILAWLCWRRHGRYATNGRVLWTVFVLLFGWPGFIGYLFHRRWPALLPCPHCERSVPLDRETCAACGRAFPDPALTGHEIFTADDSRSRECVAV